MNKEELKELAATLNGIADGKEWEITGNRLWEQWHSGTEKHSPLRLAADGWFIRLKPWSLPPPPDGMQWHRDDWTKEMLEGGWRPHLLGEVDNGDDEFLVAGEWRTGYYGSSVKTVASDHHRRTKAPLPQQPDPYAELKAAHAAGKVIQQNSMLNGAWVDDNNPIWNLCVVQYRIKPEQQKVPLGPGDVPPLSLFRVKMTQDRNTIWFYPESLTERGITLRGTLLQWSTLREDYEINRSLPLTGKWNPEAWEPCYKLIDTP